MKRASESKKARLLARYRYFRKNGNTAIAAAEMVGVPYITLRTWERGRVVSDGRKHLSVVTPDGTRFEGLTLSEAVRLVKEMS